MDLCASQQFPLTSKNISDRIIISTTGQTDKNQTMPNKTYSIPPNKICQILIANTIPPDPMGMNEPPSFSAYFNFTKPQTNIVLKQAVTYNYRGAPPNINQTRDVLANYTHELVNGNYTYLLAINNSTQNVTFVVSYSGSSATWFSLFALVILLLTL